MSKKNIVIFTAFGLMIIFLLAGVMYKNYQSNELEKMSKERAELFERPYSWSMGNKDAKVHLVEFFDPACETCAQFYPLVKDIMKKNEGKIRLTLRYAAFHENSDKAVMILEATRKQGKFTETLEMMFATQQYWTSHHKVNIESLWGLLPRIGIDMNRLVEDLKDPKLMEIVRQDLKDARALGAEKTPSFFVNGKPLQRFGYEELKELIYSEL